VDAYVEKITRMGYPVTRDDIVSSSTAAFHYLKTRRAGKTVYPVATPAFRAEMEREGIKAAEDADIVLLTFDTTLTYNKLLHACRLLQKGREYIATHPDLVCPSENGDMPDIGSFMALIELSTGGRRPSVVCGKPYAPMADYVLDRFRVPREKIAMVGDRLYTDIALGVNNNLKSVLVLTGETTTDMLARSELKPTLTLKSINELV